MFAFGCKTPAAICSEALSGCKTPAALKPVRTAPEIGASNTLNQDKAGLCNARSAAAISSKLIPKLIALDPMILLALTAI